MRACKLLHCGVCLVQSMSFGGALLLLFVPMAAKKTSFSFLIALSLMDYYYDDEIFYTKALLID